MALFRPAMTAAALCMATLLAPLAAHAANSPIVVVDFERILKESTAGKSADAQLNTIKTGIQNELGPQAQSLTNDKKALGLEGKSPQQVDAALKTDKALAAKAQSYSQKAQAYMYKEELRGRELQATLQKAAADVRTQAQPSIEEAMRAKGASIVLDTDSTVAHSADIDITNDVLARFNQRVTSVTVKKVDLTTQQQ